MTKNRRALNHMAVALDRERDSHHATALRALSKRMPINSTNKISDSLFLRSAYDFAYLNDLNNAPLKFKAYNVSLPKTGTRSVHGLILS